MRYAATVSYLGTNYSGYQRQPNQLNHKSIQESIQNAISQVAGGEKVEIFASGRTDAGVHALSQVIHFDCDLDREVDEWFFGINHFLPKDIRINQIKKVENDFHARYCAISRTYRYLIFNQKNTTPFLYQRALAVSQPLNIKKMRKAGKYLVGEHNFNAFRSTECQANNPIRKIHHCKVKKLKQDCICIEVCANAFLHNMMRILVSAIIEVGKENQKPKYIKELIKAEKRDGAIKTQSPFGLYLYDVCYSKKFIFKKKQKKICLSHFLTI